MRSSSSSIPNYQLSTQTTINYSVAAEVTRRIPLLTHENPERITAISPGLRRRSYPGYRPADVHLPPLRIARPARSEGRAGAGRTMNTVCQNPSFIPYYSAYVSSVPRDESLESIVSSLFPLNLKSGTFINAPLADVQAS